MSKTLPIEYQRVKYRNFNVGCGDVIEEQFRHFSVVDATDTWTHTSTPDVGGRYTYTLIKGLSNIKAYTFNSYNIKSLSSQYTISNINCSHSLSASGTLIITLSFKSTQSNVPSSAIAYSLSYDYTADRRAGEKYNSVYLGNAKASKYSTFGDANTWIPVSDLSPVQFRKVDHGEGYSPARYEYIYNVSVFSAGESSNRTTLNMINYIMRGNTDRVSSEETFVGLSYSTSIVNNNLRVTLHGYSNYDYMTSGTPQKFFAYEINCVLTGSFGGTKFKVKNNLAKDMNSCSVSDGGRIQLTNGDFININEYMGRITNGNNLDNDLYGIQFSLDSGHETISYAICPTDDSTDDGKVFESAYGCFYEDSPNYLYSSGQIIKIYDISSFEDYEDVSGMWLGSSGEVDSNYYGVPLIATLKYTGTNGNNGDWQLVYGNTKYIGNNVVLASGESIFVSGISCVSNEVGVYFTRSSGISSFAYYKRKDITIQETDNYWFGKTVKQPQENDSIIIYNADDAYDTLLDDDDFSEENIIHYCTCLCKLKYTSNEWIIERDYSI